MAYIHEVTPKFTFDDILLVPEAMDGEVESVIHPLFDFPLQVPILSAAMDTVTDLTMMLKMGINGGVGVHHRYCSPDMLVGIAVYEIGGIAISPSLGVDFVTDLHDRFPRTFYALDVAHGDTDRNLKFCSDLLKNGVTNIISGNVATVRSAEHYLDIGIKHVKVGIGGGSACTTRIVTGVGYPQASAIHDIYNELADSICIISDGGHNTTGDIVKAIALGADFVMLGKMLAKTKEAPMPGHYRGMASKSALEIRKNEFFVEGAELEIAPTTTVSKLLSEINDALMTACYYCGCKNVHELRNTEFVMITSNVAKENGVRT